MPTKVIILNPMEGQDQTQATTRILSLTEILTCARLRMSLGRKLPRFPTRAKCISESIVDTMGMMSLTLTIPHPFRMVSRLAVLQI